MLSRDHAEYIDALYAEYVADPSSVPPQWALVFARQDAAQNGEGRELRGWLHERTAEPPPRFGGRVIGVFDLVHSYRELGHEIADIDPLGNFPRAHPLLQMSEFGITDADLDRVVPTGSFRGLDRVPVRDLLLALQQTYCSTLGVEYLHIDEKEPRDWLQEHMERTRNQPELEPDDRRRLLQQVMATEEFELYLQRRFVGSKRFSLEGGESLVPLLDTIIEESGRHGARELVMGMAHRGRLNVLAHTLCKPYDSLLAEFDGLTFTGDPAGAGDVKYHMGYSHDVVTRGGAEIHLSLSYNPSHLEAINPVVLGRVRAKQRALGERSFDQVVPLLIHGDAAFAGQGIVYETLQLARLEGFTVGGTIHVVLNNQVGFTTDPRDARSTRYPTDSARFLQGPVFHVNADDPEAAVQAARLAVGYRQAFNTDVFIDLICYRRRGHNEQDDPTFTQPRLYDQIKEHPTVTGVYGRRLTSQGVVWPDEPDVMRKAVADDLDARLTSARETHPGRPDRPFEGAWGGFGDAPADWSTKTRVGADVLRRISKDLHRFPDGFTPHRRIPKLFAQLDEHVQAGVGIPWAGGELLAYGTLLLEGTPIRLCGQDVSRGTFSHRHIRLWDRESGERYVPLNHLDADQAQVEVVNSYLSEAAVLGYEYGFSSADPRILCIWEAQFGDFANSAQVIIDQFMSSGEAKWHRQVGMVLLLPHGFEGQGPEHSSARLERYLQLCGERNMQVVYPTTPAQIFHLLRRQVKRRFRKPLVVMSPKSLLRHKAAVSDLSELTDRDFLRVLPDPADHEPEQVRRVILCTGRLYYTLRDAVDRTDRQDVALIRVEQLYPFPTEELAREVDRYPMDADVLWVQEEPTNQGAWHFALPRILDAIAPLGRRIRYVGRPESASTAAGSYADHIGEEQILVVEALGASPDAPLVVD